MTHPPVRPWGEPAGKPTTTGGTIPASDGSQPDNTKEPAPYAGDALVQRHLGISRKELWRRHPDGTEGEFADIVEFQAGRLDSVDRDLRSTAAAIGKRLAQIAEGDHYRVDTLGALKSQALELETLGARYAQMVEVLEHSISAYQRAVPTASAADDARQKAARAGSAAAKQQPGPIATGEAAHPQAPLPQNRNRHA
ncbi:hypothetical protein [Kitasatospora sp. NPDC127116]|uniref:hypothetical protein n=1 Tax=Kitasatospora sp. NPDC127116 TaxID=3345367 RepID=UPI00363FE00F